MDNNLIKELYLDYSRFFVESLKIVNVTEEDREKAFYKDFLMNSSHKVSFLMPNECVSFIELRKAIQKIYKIISSNRQKSIVFWVLGYMQKMYGSEEIYRKEVKSFLKRWGTPSPQVLTLYRGERFEHELLGYSWTTDKRVAEMMGCKIYKVVVPKGTIMIDVNSVIENTNCDLKYGYQKEFIVDVNMLIDTVNIENYSIINHVNVA